MFGIKKRQARKGTVVTDVLPDRVEEPVVVPIKAENQAEREIPAEELSIESLFLGFGVRKGPAWFGSAPLPSGFFSPDTLGSAPLPSGFFSPDTRGKETDLIEYPSSSVAQCHVLLYTRAEWDNERFLPSFCEKPERHEGKHGKEGVAYIHPEEYPLRVGHAFTVKGHLAKINTLLAEVQTLFEELREPREL